MENNTTHHVINMGDFSTRYFSIDFEPVELRMSEWFARTQGGDFCMSEWQAVIDICCEILGKEKREVYALKEQDLPESFNSTVYEFLDHGGFHWIYFLETKTYHFHKFYYWHDVVLNKTYKGSMYNNEASFKRGAEFDRHYESVARYLKHQDLIRGREYYEPSLDTINLLVKKFLSIATEK